MYHYFYKIISLKFNINNENNISYMIKKYPTEFCLKYLVPHNIRRDNIKYTVQDRKYLHMLLNKMNNKKVEYYM